MMDQPLTLRVFVSHSWRDKPLARRIARRLAHRGVSVWIDESEMQLGDRLTARVTAEIERSTHFVVLLTKPALTSRWVAQEIKTAQSRADTTICFVPVVAEPQITSPLLDEWMGVDITDQFTFENKIDQLASFILERAAPADRDAAVLRRDLAAIVSEAPELHDLVQPLADTGQITYSQLGSVTLTEPLRHPAETALIILYELADAKARHLLSLIAAACYCKLGVGYEVMRRQTATSSPDDLSTMFNDLGRKIARREDLDGAFRLFRMSKPPHDQGFTEFINANFDDFNEGQRARAVGFMVSPDRGPGGFTIDAAYALFSRMPDNEPLRTLWWFWVHDYKFGGREGVEAEGDVRMFYSFMNSATEKGLRQFDPIMDHFESCFRGLARSKSLREVLLAVGQLIEASAEKYVHRDALAGVLQQATSSSEWKAHSPELRRALDRPLHNLVRGVLRDEDYFPLLDALSDAVKPFLGAEKKRPGN
jgi:TIR domain